MKIKRLTYRANLPAVELKSYKTPSGRFPYHAKTLEAPESPGHATKNLSSSRASLPEILGRQPGHATRNSSFHAQVGMQENLGPGMTNKPASRHPSVPETNPSNPVLMSLLSSRGHLEIQTPRQRACHDKRHGEMLSPIPGNHRTGILTVRHGGKTMTITHTGHRPEISEGSRGPKTNSRHRTLAHRAGIPGCHGRVTTKRLSLHPGHSPRALERCRGRRMSRI